MASALLLFVFFLRTFGCASAGFGRATENGFITALFAGVLHFIVLALASAHDCDRAVAAGTQVLLTNGHDLDVTFLRIDVVDHHGFAHGTDHRYRVAWLEGFGFGHCLDTH